MTAKLTSSNEPRKVVDELGANIFNPQLASVYHDALTFFITNFKYDSDNGVMLQHHMPNITELVEYFHHLSKE